MCVWTSFRRKKPGVWIRASLRLLVVVGVAGAGTARLSAQAPDSGAPPVPAAAGSAQADAHILGVLPNYTTVGPGQLAAPLTVRLTFRIATVESVDPSVLPLVGLIAGIEQLEGRERSWGSGLAPYGKRYVTSFADYGIGNFMTTAVMPTVFRQDPRYFALGKGSVLHRAGYAFSRTLVTRTRSGQRRFNQSEIVGNILGAEIANAYHPAEDRTFSATMARWESQVLFDSLTNELKEFWPDIRRRLHRA
jgi:hypothetical protein